MPPPSRKPRVTRSATSLERILFIPDTHIPYEDPEAVELMLRAARKFKPHRIVILGDYADCFMVSFHPKDLRGKPTFKAEIAAVNRRLDQLDALGATTKQYVAGNHEYRLNRYLEANQSALIDLGDWNIPSLLRLSQRGWDFTEYQQSIRIGKVYVTHDEGASGNNAHQKARGTFGSNVVIGHCHALGVSYQGNAAGEQHAGASFGWLGKLDEVTYMHRVRAQRWTHGFGIGYHEVASGHVHLQAIPIISGKCCVNGELIT